MINCIYSMIIGNINLPIIRYKMVNVVGDGTYGLVYLAYNQARLKEYEFHPHLNQYQLEIQIIHNFYRIDFDLILFN